ncbi:recombinase family protein [Saccharopolyspora erythraea]|nr:recombinase family protein [Saccharopolyspora erythraea]
MRFAFYGRTSTRRHQHRATSAAWQREAAEHTITGHGTIVAKYFDTGCSRRLPWARRPRAAALLAALDNPDRAFEAIVVGEYERAFTGNQFAHLLPLLERHGMQLWLPEAAGPFHADNPNHQALMTMLGAQSHREVLRARHRVLAAMRTQTHDQGRYLGGRPPYGYRLVDAGPHPNQAHARWGRRLQRLEPDPASAPHVRWMFTQRLKGISLAALARTLNDLHVPCPSGLDRDRNPHRSAQGWQVPTVVSILANPRYTGRRVWNRQHTQSAQEQDLPLQLWSAPQEWVISKHLTHPALVSEADFIAAQHIRAARSPNDGATRTYLLAGLVRCGLCQRRMDSHWANHRPGYRCRHGHTSSRHRSPDQPKNLYAREDHLLAQLSTHVAGLARNTAPEELAQYLRDHDLVIVYDKKGPIVTTDRA